MYFDDLEYAGRRLNGTLVRKTNGNPFLVIDVARDGAGDVACVGEDHVTGERSTVKLSEIDLTPVPLGFVNLTGGHAIFTCRKPMRRDWKQGLSTNSLVCWGEGRVSNFKLLNQPILKQYPTFTKSVDMIAKRTSVAFSRDFALIKKPSGVRLLYHKYEVGSLNDAGRLTLDPSKFFLEQHLAESVA